MELWPENSDCRLGSGRLAKTNCHFWKKKTVELADHRPLLLQHYSTPQSVLSHQWYFDRTSWTIRTADVCLMHCWQTKRRIHRLYKYNSF